MSGCSSTECSKQLANGDYDHSIDVAALNRVENHSDEAEKISGLFFFFYFFLFNFIGILLSYKSNKREVTRTKNCQKGVTNGT